MDRTIILGLANAPKDTGRLIEAGLTMAGKSWSWFLGWVVQPGNLHRLVVLAADLEAKDWPQLIGEVEELFRANHD